MSGRVCVLGLPGMAGGSVDRTAILGTTMQPFSAHALGPRNAREACLRGPAWLPDCGSASDSRMQESGSGFTAIGMLQIQGGRCPGRSTCGRKKH